MLSTACSFFFFFNDTATTEIYTLSLHDALPISQPRYTNGETKAVYAESRRRLDAELAAGRRVIFDATNLREHRRALLYRSEEHTSELQSRQYLVCRLLLEKKKKHKTILLQI